MDVLIRRYGTLIDISPDGNSPLQSLIRDTLLHHLTYTHRAFDNGYDPTNGRRSRVTIEERALYRFDSVGRLVCGYGFIPRINRLLTQAGHRVMYLDMTPKSRREGCYEPDWDLVDRRVSWRPRQRECMQRISENIGGVVVAGMGFGKTTSFKAVGLLYPKARIHIVVQSIDMVKKIAADLSTELPDVGIVYGAKKQWKRVTVVSADSLASSDGDCDFLLGDEVHQLIAPTYARWIAERYRFSRNYGFTATPTGRSDGADVRHESLFGPPIFSMTYAECVAAKLVVPIFVRWIEVSEPPRRGDLSTMAGVQKKRWGFWRNEIRNEAIAKAAREYPDDVQVLILVETIEHAVHLWQHLPHFALCFADADGEAIKRYRRSKLLPKGFPEMTVELRQSLRERFTRGALKHAIATDIWATGVDFPQLGVLIRADARESKIISGQGPGRVSRLYEGKEYGEVVDILDSWDTGFRKKSVQRKAAYASFEWEQAWPEERRREHVGLAR